MIYNKKYDLYIDEDLVIYYWNNRYNKLMQRHTYEYKGYLKVLTKMGMKRVHRIIWETFNGEIPDGMEIDHINTVRNDNRLSNLRCVSPKDNMNNPLTLIHLSKAKKDKLFTQEHKSNLSKAKKGKTSNVKGKYRTEFGRKFKEHFNIDSCDNHNLYCKELMWFKQHGKCRWE